MIFRATTRPKTTSRGRGSITGPRKPGEEKKIKERLAGLKKRYQEEKEHD